MKKFIPILKELAKDKIMLLVEDDEYIIKSLSAMLSRFFIDVYKAEDAEKALEIYENLAHSNIPIVVITDINLGEKSGIDLTYSLKKMNPEQKVIAISGTEDKDIFVSDYNVELTIPSDAYIEKPLLEHPYTLYLLLKKKDPQDIIEPLIADVEPNLSLDRYANGNPYAQRSLE